jgi:GNAT superfamily N-acetyltransferase
MLSVKSASVADIPLIRELTMQVWPQTYTPIVGKEQVAYMLDAFYAPAALERQMQELNHRFIICYSDIKAVAFASWSEIQEGVFKLHKIYIVAGQQGKGIGKFMIGYIAGELKHAKATELRLNVNRYNVTAKSFYEKTGFQHLNDEDIDIGDGYFMNDHVLVLHL